MRLKRISQIFHRLAIFAIHQPQTSAPSEHKVNLRMGLACAGLLRGPYLEPEAALNAEDPELEQRGGCGKLQGVAVLPIPISLPQTAEKLSGIAAVLDALIELAISQLAACRIEDESLAGALNFRSIKLAAEQRNRIEVVRNMPIEWLGVCGHIAVTGLEAGEAVAAFEVEGGDAAPGRPSKSGGRHEFVAAGKVQPAVGEQQLVFGNKRVEGAFDAREIIVRN